MLSIDEQIRTAIEDVLREKTGIKGLAIWVKNIIVDEIQKININGKYNVALESYKNKPKVIKGYKQAIEEFEDAKNVVIKKYVTDHGENIPKNINS